MSELDIARLAANLAHWLETQRDDHAVSYLPWLPVSSEYFVELGGAPPVEALALQPVAEAETPGPGTAVAVIEAPRDGAPERKDVATVVPVVPVVRTDAVVSTPALAAPASAPAAAAVAHEGAQTDALRAKAQAWSNAQKLNYLRESVIGDCQRCPLARGRKNLVFGVGNPEASVMFVGEAPGAQEDEQGEPFVGAAGQRLNRWIEGAGLRRSDVFIANVLKCRPPGNRDPQPLEIERCSGFLRAQIRAVSPRVIVALGRFAGALLLGRSDNTLSKMRGIEHAYFDPRGDGRTIPTFVTFHPSYVLRCEKDQGGKRPPGQDSRPSEDEVALHDVRRAISRAREGSI